MYTAIRGEFEAEKKAQAESLTKARNNLAHQEKLRKMMEHDLKQARDSAARAEAEKAALVQAKEKAEKDAHDARAALKTEDKNR